MFVGLIIIAMLSGLLAAVLALMLSMPFWAALLAYSLTGSAVMAIAALAVNGPKGRKHTRIHVGAVPAAPGK